MRGRLSEVDEGGRSVKTSQCFASALTARFRGGEARLAWCRSCRNGLSAATSAATVSADRPVMLRSPVSAALDAFPTT